MEIRGIDRAFAPPLAAWPGPAPRSHTPFFRGSGETPPRAGIALATHDTPCSAANTVRPLLTLIGSWQEIVEAFDSASQIGVRISRRCAVLSRVGAERSAGGGARAAFHRHHLPPPWPGRERRHPALRHRSRGGEHQGADRRTGGSAFVYGISSGAALALEAANRLSGIKKLVVYEAPFVVDRTTTPLPAGFVDELTKLLEASYWKGSTAQFPIGRHRASPRPTRPRYRSGSIEP